MDIDVDPDFQIQNPRTAKILNAEYITDTILDAVSPVDILYFALTCRLAKRTVARYRAFTFNINRRLRRFFRKPLAFRSLQARTHTLISGSFALQFFDRSNYAESDLDLYTHPGCSKSVGEWLIDEGYEFKAGPTQDESFDVAEKSNWRGTRAPYGAQESSEWNGYQWNGVWEVYSFQQTEGDNRMKVQIIASSISPLETVLNFHSTIVHNFISYSHAYSLYPNATFIHRQGLCIERATERYQEALAKYRARGWDIQESPLVCRADFHVDVNRWVNDRMSWVIPLDVDGVELPQSRWSLARSDDLVAVNNFKLTFDTKAQRQRQVKMIMSYETLVHPLLRYQYLIVDTVFLDFFKSFMNELWGQLQGQLAALPAGVREQVWPWLDGMMSVIRQTVVSAIYQVTHIQQ